MLFFTTTLYQRAGALLFFLLVSGCLVRGQGESKEARVLTVFNRLIEARGDARTPPPTLLFSRRKAHAASATGRTIVLEEAAYDVCAALGDRTDDALAGLLAHELIHYYENHEWEDGFIRLVDTQGLGERVREDTAALTKDEIEADYLGGFLAQLAGYRSVGLMADLLAGIYAAYDLPDDLAGYPSLAERRSLARRATERLEELTDVFEVGNLLVALGRYEEAAAYYQYLLRDFQSRELYNNLGVLYALAALDQLDAAGLPGRYPFELDVVGRMETGTRGLTRDRALGEAMLREAIRSFERTVLLDPAYPSGHLNLAAAQSLLAHALLTDPPAAGSEIEAEDLLLSATVAVRKAQRNANPTDEDFRKRADDLRALIQRQLAGDVVPAAAPEAPAPPAPAADGFTMRETIGGHSLDDLLLRSVSWTSNTLIDGMHAPMHLRTEAGDGTTVTKLLHEVGDAGWLFLRADSAGDGGTSLDVTVGSPLDDVLLEYGDPGRRVRLAGGGELLVYPASELLFVVREGAVRTWYLYRALR